jgi:hypothetical protein
MEYRGIRRLEVQVDSVPSKSRVCAYFPDDSVVKILERQAVVENRSLSNLVATILIKATQEFEQQQSSREVEGK